MELNRCNEQLKLGFVAMREPAARYFAFVSVVAAASAFSRAWRARSRQ
jgi:hypothetical protein